jgi:hypothetical protein
LDTVLRQLRPLAMDKGDNGQQQRVASQATHAWVGLDGSDQSLCLIAL